MMNQTFTWGYVIRIPLLLRVHELNNYLHQIYEKKNLDKLIGKPYVYNIKNQLSINKFLQRWTTVIPLVPYFNP